MMTFGQKRVFAAKKKISQAELGNQSGINGDIIGKFEGDEMKPSIEDKAHIFYALDNLIKAAKHKAI